jgi:hypothetical protein
MLGPGGATIRPILLAATLLVASLAVAAPAQATGAAWGVTPRRRAPMPPRVTCRQTHSRESSGAPFRFSGSTVSVLRPARGSCRSRRDANTLTPAFGAPEAGSCVKKIFVMCGGGGGNSEGPPHGRLLVKPAAVIATHATRPLASIRATNPRAPAPIRERGLTERVPAPAQSPPCATSAGFERSRTTLLCEPRRRRCFAARPRRVIPSERASRSTFWGIQRAGGLAWREPCGPVPRCPSRRQRQRTRCACLLFRRVASSRGFRPLALHLGVGARSPTRGTPSIPASAGRRHAYS